MRKKGYKGRTEKRILSKCNDVCRTYDAIQFAYADILQTDDSIREIRCNVPLDGLPEGEYTSDLWCMGFWQLLQQFYLQKRLSKKRPNL